MEMKERLKTGKVLQFQARKNESHNMKKNEGIINVEGVNPNIS